MRSEAFWRWFDGYAAPLLVQEKWKMPRDKTFRMMFEYLEALDRPVRIVETGCIETVDADGWGGNGCSTVLFDKYVETHSGSTAISFEIDADKVVRAQKICPLVTVVCSDSVKGLAAVKSPIDLLYLDASHHNWLGETPTQVHHFSELMAAMPVLTDGSLVVVDDTVASYDDYPQSKITGKGGLVSQYALEIGAELRFCGYQTGFTGMTRKAPTKADAGDLIERARKFIEDGNQPAADRIYYLVLIITPPPLTGKMAIARGEACANFARRAHRLRRWGSAIDWFHRALQVDPLGSDYRCEMVFSLAALGALNTAKREATIAAELEPSYPRCWQTLGGVESDLMNAEACIEAYDKQIEASVALPERNDIALSDAYQNRATIALDTEDYPLVRTLAESVVAMKVREGDGWQMLAMLENRLSNHEKALEYFDKALAADCRNKPLCHWNKALSLECLGRLKEAGQEKSWNEQEMTVLGLYMPRHRFNKPRWRGEGNCTVHVHTEAGFGDNISMWRYLPLIVARGCTVHHETSPELLSLATANFPDVVTMPRSADYPGIAGVKAFDYQIAVGDIPHAFGTDLDTIPWSGPYIKADPRLVAEYNAKLPKNGRLKVGLCWSSGIRLTLGVWMKRYGLYKSLRYGETQHLFDRLSFENIDLMSLQVGPERRWHEDEGGILDVLPEKPTWDETAALVANLDLVITVDTGLAHLVGSMGKPVWVMTRRDGSSWHFMCWRPGASWNERSPWYPTARIFRQHEFKDDSWDDVIADVSDGLRSWLAQTE